jgi:hypothetical protein
MRTGSFIGKDGLVHEGRQLGYSTVHTGCFKVFVQPDKSDQEVNCLACIANNDPMRFMSVGGILAEDT